MTYAPTTEQQEVIAAEDPVLLVLGGAGTGKTTTAAAAVGSTLERLDAMCGETGSRKRSAPARSLFLSFSRASVAQILNRTSPLLEQLGARVEITTFHAFAWRMLKRWGSVVGKPAPLLLSESEAKLFEVPGAVRYKDLVPLALDLCDVPAVRRHLQTRWSLIVSDEFQDTDDQQFELLLKIRGEGRLLLLGDSNQCIYSTLPDVHGVGPERLAAALALPGARLVEFPDVSHRDPTNVLPAAAAAIRRREFGHAAVAAALTTGRLEVRAGLSVEAEADEVAAVVQDLSADGSAVGVFSHHIDATAALSDKLAQRNIDHEIVGLPECLGAALEAQHTMVQFAAGNEPWESVVARLAVFVTSSVRGKAVPELARMLLGQRESPVTLKSRLNELRDVLASSAGLGAVEHAAVAHTRLGLPRGHTNWERAARLLRPLVARSLHLYNTNPDPMEELGRIVRDRHMELLTYSVSDGAHPIQLMGLYQTKGREADATVVVLRSSDFFGLDKDEPFEVGSRLLYVVLTRARVRTVVLVFGNDLPPLVAPLTELPSISTNIAGAG